jgi:hypothetical protein
MQKKGKNLVGNLSLAASTFPDIGRAAGDHAPVDNQTAHYRSVMRLYCRNRNAFDDGGGRD